MNWKSSLKVSVLLILGIAAVVGFLGYFRISQTTVAFGNLGFLMLASAYYYRQWKEYYAPDYNKTLKLFLALVLTEIVWIANQYRLLEGYIVSRIAISSIIAVVQVILWIVALYYMFWRKSNPKKETWSEYTVDELIYGFAWQSKMWSDGYNSPDDETEEIDKAYGLSYGAYLELKNRGEEQVLRRFLNSKHVGSRVLAARCLVWTNEKDAVRTLEEVGNGQDVMAEVARTMLEYWASGKMPKDPDLETQAK